MEVQIMSRKLIKPSIPTPHHLRKLKLSFIDQLAPPAYPILILYYPNIDESDDIVERRRDRLEKSLSEALTVFYPFAGRFMKDDVSVECNDEGVEYLEARVNGGIERAILEGKTGAVEVLAPLVSDSGVVDLCTTPLVTIQVNIFGCGGLAIAVRVCHKIADAVAGMAFINGWATASRAGVSQVIRPSFDLASAIPARISLPPQKPPLQMDTSGLSIVTRRFVFDGTTLSTLKSEVIATAASSRPPTRNEVVSAAIWRALIGTNQGRLRASMIVHSVNLRGKTDPPVPNHSSGNFYALAAARFEPDEAKIELHELVELIRDSIRKTVKNCSNLGNADEFCSAVFNELKEVQEKLWKQQEDNMNVHMFTSWCKLPLYEADFGWGKQFWTSGARRDVKMVCLVDTPCGDGVEAWVSLNEQEMLIFQHILAFTS